MDDGSDKANPGRNHALTAAMLGGAAAAAAGAVWGARALARRNGAEDGKPLNAVMEMAVTACELAHSPSASPPASPSAEPKVPSEPKVRSEPPLPR